MTLSADDERWLLHALDLADAAAAFASPNPSVGCVLVRANQPIGDGAHVYQRFDHAEIAALKDAANRGHTPLGATAYVTLEPCSHHGRTGPCADALIHAGVATVIIATVDPNPLVSGTGIARLRAAGIDVRLAPDTSAIATRARRLIEAFACSIQTSLPLVTLKAALSVDGKLAPPPTLRTAHQPHWLTGPAAREDVHRLRHASDAILTGIGTLLADNASLTDRSGLPRGRRLVRCVLDTHLRTPLDAAFLRHPQADALIFCAQQVDPTRAHALQQAGAEIFPCPAPNDQLDLRHILKHLHTRRLNSVLIEAGSRLNASFLAQHLVDKVILYFAELELGPQALPFAAGGPSPFVLQQHMRCLERSTFPHGAHDDIRITGYLRDPWPSVTAPASDAA